MAAAIASLYLGRSTMYWVSETTSGECEFGFAQAIRVEHTIYVSGQLSHDEEGEFLFPDDFDADAVTVGVDRGHCGDPSGGGGGCRV
ncbi:RidA family protein, partial [Streptomyces scabiei]|uniref:RidA family protein n=1 Tax=Streptomyces scabiei TaxID=1930 RepID=UPI0029AB0F17